jgi:hypothetical protein
VITRAENEGGAEKQELVIPLDEYLGTDKLPFKMTKKMMVETAFWGQNQTSFKSAEKVMGEKFGIRITDDHIRKVTYYVGKMVYEADTKRAMEAYGNMINMQYTHDKEGILYIMLDGAAINTRKKDKNDSTWRENKLAVVFSSDNMRLRKDGVTHDLLKKEYVSFLGNAEEFKKYVFECAVRNGYGQYKTTVVISDGATWIRNMCDEILPDAVQILDFYHLKENIYSFGKYKFKNDAAQYAPWAEGIAGLLKKSEWAQVLSELKKYKNKTYPGGLVNPYTYITNNINKIDYAAYKKAGYPIGSGAIESGNKSVLQKRCKQAGMQWDVTNAQYLLSLRAKDESGLWEDSVEKAI